MEQWINQQKHRTSEFNQARRVLQGYRDTRVTTLVATSSDRMKTLRTDTSDTQHPSSGGKIKSYSDIGVGRYNNSKFEITIRSTGNQAPEII